MRLNNIYTAGDYFFLDFSVDNKTNIRFDIDQTRLKLDDKKDVEKRPIHNLSRFSRDDVRTSEVIQVWVS